MVQATTSKLVGIIFPQAIKDNTEFVGSKGSTPVSVDTKGFDYARVLVMVGATDIKMATMKLWESDDDSTYTEVTGGNFGSPDALPTATDDNKLWAWNVNLAGGRKRYLRVELIPGDGTTGTYAVAWAELSRAEEAPNSATTRGLAAELNV